MEVLNYLPPGEPMERISRMSEHPHHAPQPPLPPDLLRSCTECHGPMLLMSALMQNHGFVTKLYECWICKKTEEIMAIGSLKRAR